MHTDKLLSMTNALVVQYDVGPPDVFRRHVERVYSAVVSRLPRQTAVRPFLCRTTTRPKCGE